MPPGYESKEEPEVTIEYSSTLKWSYELIQGDIDNVALFRRRRDQVKGWHLGRQQPGRAFVDDRLARLHTYTMTIEGIMEYFTPSNVSFEQLAKELDLNSDKNGTILLGLCLAANLYKGLGGATVDVRTAQFNFNNAHWMREAADTIKRMRAPTGYQPQREHRREIQPAKWVDQQQAQINSALILSTYPRDVGQGEPRRGVQPAKWGDQQQSQINSAPILSIYPRDVDHAICFACITMFETGTFNLYPDQLSRVFAVSASDSLYIASALLRDPASNPRQTAIRRYTGNIGRAGVAFLVPPVDPLVRDYGIEEWYEYNRKDFDGTLDDCFSGTSLHLSFSEASIPVDVGYSGGRDIEAYLLESLVSVYDRQRLIGELDILATFASKRLTTDFLTSGECDHSFKNPSPLNTRTQSFARSVCFSSIDNFAEIINPPPQPGIIRARGNWQARLAAASICIAKDYRVIMRPERLCLDCLSKIYMEQTGTTIATLEETEVVMIL